MAYLSVSEPGIPAPAGYVPQPLVDRRPAGRTTVEIVADPARLSALEWSVVAIAWSDRLSSLRRPGRMATALAAVFGGKASRQLGDPRLEALRRMAVLTWHHGWSVPPHEVRAFQDAGFSADQYELLVDSIGKAQANERTRSPR